MHAYTHYPFLSSLRRHILSPFFFSLLLLSAASCGTPDNQSSQSRKGKIKSVLIIGNSIVRHGPAPQIGWQGDWGMAASTRDSDFVHLLTRAIQAKDTAVSVRSGLVIGFEGGFEQYPFAKLDSFTTPDMLIVRLSENVDDSKAADGKFMRYYDSMIHYIDPKNHAVKVIVNGIWNKPVVNELLKKYATEHHYIFVRNDDLLADSTNLARGLFTNEGVAAHPSDKGMRLIKERIWEQIKNFF